MIGLHGYDHGYYWEGDMKQKGRMLAAAMAAAMLFSGCGSQTEDISGLDLNFSVDYDGIKTGSVNARGAVHDPSIIAVDGDYYIFGSHMTAAKSENMRQWTMLGNGYSAKNPVYTDLADTDPAEFAYSGQADSLIPTDDGRCHVWAPDVIYNKAMGKYVMYYCTTSTWNASNLCYATADAVEGPYTWQGALIYSGFTKETIGATDVLDYVSEDYALEQYVTLGNEYNFREYPNAIDPTVFYDADGRMWMVYGSWSGGIFLLELDEKTGQVIHPQADEENRVDAYFGKKLLGGGHKSIEGPYILYDEASGYYYLFVSYGGLVSNGGYQIRVFRSQTVDGDYVDMNDKYPTEEYNHAFYGLKLSGNYLLPSLRQAYMATGHNSAMVDTDGRKYICYHTRFADGTENHSPRVKQFFVNEEGWPCMLPYATDGETIAENGYQKDEIVGMYYVINQGTAIDAEIAKPEMLYLSAKGNVYRNDGDPIGSWSVTKDTAYMHLTMFESEYSGVFCAMKDEAGTEVMTFTAVGSNESIWGVKYEQ